MDNCHVKTKGQMKSHESKHREYVLKTEKEGRAGITDQLVKFGTAKDTQMCNSLKASGHE